MTLEISYNRDGTARVGVEWAFWDDWSVKLEYDYYGFGQRNGTFIDATSGNSGLGDGRCRFLHRAASNCLACGAPALDFVILRRQLSLGAKDLAPAIGIDNSDLRDPPMNDIFFGICLAAFAIGTIGVTGQIIDEILERRRWMEWMSSPAETARREQNRTARRKRNREMAIFMIIYIGCASLACIDHWVRWPSNP